MDIQQVNTVLAMRKARLAAGEISQAQALEPITGDEARLDAAKAEPTSEIQKPE